MVVCGVHGAAERANTLFKEAFAALQTVSLSPTRVGAITKAALLLLHLEHDRPCPAATRCGALLLGKVRGGLALGVTSLRPDLSVLNAQFARRARH